MPIYEYNCDSCSMDFQYLYREGVPPICPRCWEQRVTKQLSAFNGKVEGKTAAPDKSADSGLGAKPHVHSGNCCEGKKTSQSSCPGAAAESLIEKHLGK